MCAALNKAGLLELAPAEVWKKQWVVDCRPVGDGEKALEYLGRYVFRVALSNSRLERIEGGQVTFRYRDSRSRRMRRVTLSGVEFLRRFILHALPRGFTKVRYYGLWSSSCRPLLKRAQTLLQAPPPPVQTDDCAQTPGPPTPAPVQQRCPYCRIGRLIVIGKLLPQREHPP